MTHLYHVLESPLGRLHMVTDAHFLCALAFDSNWDRIKKGFPDIRTATGSVALSAAQQLREYFDGTRQCFNIPCKPRGTDFQRRAWQSLLSIRYGETSNYKTQAHRIGQPSASRAVGHANGQNPISIIVPCHRVIASSGRLAGYAGGLDAKDFLLQHETQNLLRLSQSLINGIRCFRTSMR